MTDTAPREVWLPVTAIGDELVVSLNGEPGLMWKGGDTIFRLALFEVPPIDENAPGTFRNHANLTTFFLKIRSVSYAGTALLTSADALATTTILSTTSELDFVQRKAAPISIYCPGSITALTAATLYMTLSGTLAAFPANLVGFGRGRIVVEDIGLGLADSVVPAGATAVTTDVYNADRANFVRFGKNVAGKTATFVSANGSYGRTKGTTDDGEEMSVLETY